MADSLTIQITGLEFTGRLERAAAQLDRPLELMQRVGKTLEANIAQRFNSKTDPAGNAWAPLAASTLARKKGRGSILEFTGHGKASLAYNAGGDFVEVGFGSDYMGYHETGTQRMPRRQLLSDDFVAGTLGRRDEEDILADVQVFLNELGL